MRRLRFSLLVAMLSAGMSTGCDRIPGVSADDTPLVREAHERYRAAMAARDLTALKALVVDARRAELDAPDAADKIAMAGALTPAQATVTAIAIRGDAATVSVTAPAEGGTATGTVQLAKERGVWKVGHEAWSIQIGAAPAPPPAPAPAPAADVARPTNFNEIRGQWRGTESGGQTVWTFSFGDRYEVVARSDAGFYRGQAAIYWDLGKAWDGSMRVPPGSTPMDVTISEASTPSDVGRISLGAFMKVGSELKLCGGAPGSLVRARDFGERSATMRCFSLTQTSPEPEGAIAAAVTTPAAPPAPAAPATSTAPPPAADDATGELSMTKDGVAVTYPLKTGFRSQTRMKKPGRVTVHFGLPPSQAVSSYHGIVLTLDGAQRGAHYADGDEIRSVSFADDHIAVGTPTRQGRKAVFAWYADGGQMFPPKTGCTVEITSPYTGAPAGVFAGRMSECVVHSAGIDYTLTGLRFTVRGVSKR